MPAAVGVDGCPYGWVAVWPGGFGVWPRLDTMLRDLDPEVLALDMPIGLADDGPRTCDRLARQQLGWPRASSMFPPPVRAALRAGSHPETGDLNAAACGQRISVQAYHLLPKLREVDALLRTDGGARKRVVEVHPEVSFACWAGAPMTHNKKRRAGRTERQTLIAEHFGASAYPDARNGIDRPAAGDDDIADAFAALWTAVRLMSARHIALPDPPEWDRYGLPMRICA